MGVERKRRRGSDPDAIGSVDSALVLLELFESVSSLRLTDVSTSLAISSSSAHRLLTTFERRGFVEQIRPHGAYTVGPRLARLVAGLDVQADVRAATYATMIELAREVDETVCVAILQGTDVRFVAAVESRRRSAATMPRMMVMPTHATAAGKALIADYTRADVERLYPSEHLPRITSKTLTSRESLMRELERTRERGYAIHSEETHPHYIAYGHPIRDQAGNTRAAFVVVGPTQRFNQRSAGAIVHVLQDAATRSAQFKIMENN